MREREKPADDRIDDYFEVVISLEHRVRLTDGDLYDEIIQRYSSRIVLMHDEKPTVVGTFEFFIANVALAANNGLDMVDVADAFDQDVNDYCAAVFEPGTASCIREDVLDQFDDPIGSRLLMLHLAKVHPEYRGRRLALQTARHLIEHFGDGLVVAKAQPLQHHGCYNTEGEMHYASFEPDRAKALKRLTRHWQRLGFKPIGDTGHLGLSTAGHLPDIGSVGEPGSSESAPPRRERKR